MQAFSCERFSIPITRETSHYENEGKDTVPGRRRQFRGGGQFGTLSSPRHRNLHQQPVCNEDDEDDIKLPVLTANSILHINPAYTPESDVPTFQSKILENEPGTYGHANKLCGTDGLENMSEVFD